MIRSNLLSVLGLIFLGLIVAYLYHNPSVQKLPMRPPTPQTTAIIIGSGLAGLSAASELIAKNIPVLLLERGTKPGGNSIKASSGINGAPTKYQSTVDEMFYADTVASAGRAMESSTAQRSALIATLTQESKRAIDWLVEEKGVNLSKIALLGGHNVARTHRGAGGPPPGWAIISALLSSLKESPLFQLQTSCTVTRLLRSQVHSSQGVTGVEYICASKDVEGDEHGERKLLHGPVIVAAGGFAGDALPAGILARYRPELACYPSTNEPRPSPVHLLADVGAQLVDMQHVQVHPTGFVDPDVPSSRLKILAAEVLRGEGGILLRDGQRFVNELDTRESVSRAITQWSAEREDPRQWDVKVVLDEGSYVAAKSHADFYISKGLMKKTTIAELGPGVLDTIQRYARVVRGEEDDVFRRKQFANWGLQEPEGDSVVYVGSVTPVVHFTMGGALISERAEVLGKEGEAVEGLWAAGEVTGGVHGENRLGGSSLLECVVFGRIAGKGCAEYIGSRST